MDTDDASADGAAEDERLVLRCQLGERDAFDPLIARWHPLLWRYALRLTNDADAAADATQEMWMRVLRGLPSLRDAAKFRAWLFGIARRVLMDRLRGQYAEPRMEQLDIDVIDTVTSDDAHADVALLEAEVGRLPILEREVLVLFYLRELSLNDIASIAAIPVGTVKSRLFRARQMLRRQLQQKGMDP